MTISISKKTCQYKRN